MAATESVMIPLGTPAPDFNLRIANPNVDTLESDFRSFHDYANAKLLVVVFTCNHCPYAIHVEDRLIELARETAPRGVQFVAINSNDAENYPADSFENMVIRATEKSFPFPYLHDENQSVAKAYSAVCTPDFFVFDERRLLVYRGRLDDGTPGRPQTTTELKDALESLLAGHPAPEEQIPSIGCNIKWKNAA